MKKKGEERKQKVKVKTATMSLLNPKPISKFCFLCMPKLRKLIFCIWNRRPWSVWPVNGFVVGFSSLEHDSDQKTTRLASKCVFFVKIPRGEWVIIIGMWNVVLSFELIWLDLPMRHCDKFNPLFLSLRKISVNWLE